MDSEKVKVELKENFKKFMVVWGGFSNNVKISIFITLFFWFSYFFMDLNVEWWQIFIVNLMVLYGLNSSHKNKKKVVKEGVKDGRGSV